MEKMINKKIIDSEGLIECFKKHHLETYSLDDIIDVIRSYTQTIVPDVNVGDTVWVIKEDYISRSIIECTVIRKTIKSRYTFTVKGLDFYYGTFTRNSIGKKVFYSEEDAYAAFVKITKKTEKNII